MGPINAVAKLKLNMNPELDVPAFEIPKVDLFLEMQKLAVGMTRAQYQRLIELADGMSAMTRGIPYRKFRPYNTRKQSEIKLLAVNYLRFYSFCVFLAYRGNSKIWWHFAYKCIVETEIKRKKDNWSWLHMQQHRDFTKCYAEVIFFHNSCAFGFIYKLVDIVFVGISHQTYMQKTDASYCARLREIRGKIGSV